MAIVQSIIGVAQAKGLRTTAEGVETEEQSEILNRLGCGFQGFPALEADVKRNASPISWCGD